MLNVNEPLAPPHVYPLPQFPENVVNLIKVSMISLQFRELRDKWSCEMADIKPLHGGGISRFYLLAPKRQRREQRQNKKKGIKHA